MSVFLSNLREGLAARLGDASAAIWTAAELDGYLREGYDDLTQRTGCLWATDVLPDYAMAFCYTAEWESGYWGSGWAISSLGNFTATWERDYLDNARGPANHSHHWEFNGGYVSWETLVSALDDLPVNLQEVERATWNTRSIEALSSRYLETEDGRYELNRGAVEGYTQDKDGLNRFRKWRVPSAPYVPYSTNPVPARFDSTQTWESTYLSTVSARADYSSIAESAFVAASDSGPAPYNHNWEYLYGFVAGEPVNGEFGILVQITDVTTQTAQEQWGEFVQVDGQHGMGDPWGVIVGIYTEPNNVRLEYRRRGAALSAMQPFEIADRYTVYVRHYAQARALSREGPGQELELSAHFSARYEAGIARMLKRRQAVQFQMSSVLGSGGTEQRARRPQLARLPWQYGTVVRG